MWDGEGARIVVRPSMLPAVRWENGHPRQALRFSPSHQEKTTPFPSNVMTLREVFQEPRKEVKDAHLMTCWSSPGSSRG